MIKADTPLLDNLRAHLNHDAKRYIIGYSGGRDSHVLLHALCALRDNGALKTPLTAIHINHQLNAKAYDWAKHCQAICDAYGIPLIIETVSESPQVGESVEAFAREARYRLIAKHLHKNDVFLSAHHQRDQAETFLLQLMRGAGLDGLRAMPFERELGVGRYCRPLLHVDYADILAYAMAQQLDFIHDDSNDDTRFDRNFLRHEIFPVLEKRFPKACANISRSAQWLAEVPEAVAPQHLFLEALKALSEQEQKQRIRAFIKSKTGRALSQTQTHYLIQHHLHAKADKHPQLDLHDVVVRRHAGKLCVTSALPDWSVDKLERQTVRVGDVLTTPVGVFNWGVGQAGITTRAPLTLQPLRGSERFHPHTRSCATTVKKCLNEAKIPAWLRPYYFGVYLNNRLIAIPNIGVERDYYECDVDAYFPQWQIKSEFIGI